ncbi:hypothetical protein Prum_064990 [Phytohabitans rumicis]|uniref:Uncharacterized protein n=1 Tax=Phytohabitans rumicis TaxID=1076125 RepID=A0A6V8LFM8_9ACTN|nr:hypothetical protein Prum_064990 [Phytohabitans rumicis]
MKTHSSSQWAAGSRSRTCLADIAYAFLDGLLPGVWVGTRRWLDLLGLGVTAATDGDSTVDGIGNPGRGA